jgi:ELWxxDGT repeat protein
MTRSTLLLAACALALVPAARAQEPFLVADLASTPAIDASGIQPFELERLGDALYFAADDGLSGSELWRTDGTAAGTRRVVDLCPGRCGSQPSGPVRFDGQLYFYAADGPLPASRFWRSDGTAAGTRPAEKDGIPGRPYRGAVTAVLGGETFFLMTEARHGTELWKTRGGLAEAVLVKDILPGPDNGVFEIWGTSGGRVVLLANDGLHGFEVWSSDGTAAGTRMVRDLNPRNSGVPIFTVGDTIAGLGNHFYFRGDDGVGGAELWRTDGTPAGTTLVRDLVPGRFGAFPFGLLRAGRLVYFVAADGRGGTTLWRTDGTTVGTRRLELADGAFPTQEMVTLGRLVIFTAVDERHGQEIWRTDGTPKGTYRLADVAPGALHGTPIGLVRAGDQVFFHAEDPVHGRELWRTDGLRQGTRRVADLVPGAGSGCCGRGAELAGRFVFTSSAEGGNELWSSDGTASGTRKIVDIHPAERSSNPRPLAALGENLLFAAHLEQRHLESLWRSDGSAGGTVQLATLDSNDIVASVAALPAEVIFSTGARMLWASDGTPAGTARVAGLDNVRGLAGVGARAFFVANATDLPANTLFVREQGSHTPLGRLFETGPSPFVPDPPSPLEAELPAVAAGDRYFVLAMAYRVEGTAGLWVSDGTAAGTLQVAGAEILCPVACYGFRDIAATGDQVFFNVFGQDGLALWRSDGTTAGTRRLLLVPWLTFEQGPRALTVAGDRLFFVAADDEHGEELWTSDGTVAGTRLVTDIQPGAAGSRIVELRAVGETVFFGADDGQRGRELWTSDGTEGGTILVADLRRGPQGSEPQALAAVDGRLAFAAAHPAHGLELWSSDGTAAGTALVADVLPGRRSASPSGLVAAGDLVYFSAGTAATGFELWALALAALGSP